MEGDPGRSSDMRERRNGAADGLRGRAGAQLALASGPRAPFQAVGGAYNVMCFSATADVRAGPPPLTAFLTFISRQIYILK